MAAQSAIGILGAGEIGRAVADKAVRHGHEVLIGNSRGPETLKTVVEQLGSKAHAVTAEEAAQPDLVFLAVPFSAVPDLTSLTDWAGKIVVDTTNQFAAANPWRGRYDVGDLTGSEWVAQRLPGARIVKAFNSLFAAFIAADPQHEEGHGELADEPISVHASTLLHQALTVRGATLGRWLLEASAERRASDSVAATLIALAFKDQFDVAATYDLGELATAVKHAVQPGKVGTVLIRP
ncbi:NADP oxidoreductase coenzyme F420-dependent [Streptomyces sp. 1222.5]|nr:MULTISPECIES: NAD(P)-binding domain-containing protein [unclassified Streptomyces]PKW11060.1 coenzyme F420-dependent NADP oxidoreductase-like protein [Streptomyces sp. 5112.2]SEB89215.1 NADP oxidoreductase coenzyme F420-dependent [Streptomyces sp. 1222.5]